jgi:hypothetical protein
MACSARQLVAWTPGVRRKVNSAGAKKGEQRGPFLGEMGQQPAVGWVGGPSGDELVDRGVQSLGPGDRVGGLQPAGVAGIPDRQGLLEDAADRVGSLGLAPLGIDEQLVAAAQQVR